jgi:hypothetical protein
MEKKDNEKRVRRKKLKYETKYVNKKWHETEPQFLSTFKNISNLVSLVWM